MQVRVKVARRTSGIPGVAGRPEPRMEEGLLPYMEADSTTIKEVSTYCLGAHTAWGHKWPALHGVACLAFMFMRWRAECAKHARTA
jgi:hypothetical protein